MAGFIGLGVAAPGRCRSLSVVRCRSHIARAVKPCPFGRLPASASPCAHPQTQRETLQTSSSSGRCVSSAPPTFTTPREPETRTSRTPLCCAAASPYEYGHLRLTSPSLTERRPITLTVSISRSPKTHIHSHDCLKICLSFIRVGCGAA